MDVKNKPYSDDWLVYTLVKAIKQNALSIEKHFGDKPYLIVGRKSYTPAEIASEVEEGTEFGKDTVKGMIGLMIELIMRQNKAIPLGDKEIEADRDG